MKIIISALSIFLWMSISCQSPQAILANKAICYYDTTITKEEISFDVIKYAGLLSEERHPITSTNDYFDDNIIYQSINDHQISNWQTNTVTSLQKLATYTQDGKIIDIDFYYNYEAVGKSFRYDEKGNIEEITDHDKGYKVCWAQAIEIAKKFERRHLSRDSLIRIWLDRDEWRDTPDFKPQWKVRIVTAAKNQPPPTFLKRDKVFVLDGITGKLIKTYILKRSTNDFIEIRPRQH